MSMAPDIPDIRVLSGYGEFPQAHHFGLYQCPACPHAHIVLFNEADEPIAQFVIGPKNVERIHFDADYIFAHRY